MIHPPKNRRFIFEFVFFLNYLGQQKLMYLLVGMAAANILLLIPFSILATLVSFLLFLGAYKIAFEIMIHTADGHFTFEDKYDFGISDTIGIKAMGMAVLQLLIFFFVYLDNPALGSALLLISVFLTPAHLMLLSQTQSFIAALNPIDLFEIVRRIGVDYILLSVFIVVLGALEIGIQYLMVDTMPTWIEDIVLAFIMYYFLALAFLVMGYVVYHHSDELDYTPHDVEDTTGKTSMDDNDPIKRRIEDLIENKEPQAALAIIKDMQKEGRNDLSALAHQAQSLLTVSSRMSPKEQLTHLITKNEMANAVTLWKTYHQDGHQLRPDATEDMRRLIDYCNDKHQFTQVIQMVKGLDKYYVEEPQFIVDQFFLSSKILYQNKKHEQAGKLLQSIITKYDGQADVSAPTSYLKGLQKMGKI